MTSSFVDMRLSLNLYSDSLSPTKMVRQCDCAISRADLIARWPSTLSSASTSVARTSPAASLGPARRLTRRIRYATMAQLLSRVLVVDDDEGIRRFAARALGHAGYQVETASDGSEAIRLVEAEPRFDLFVIDVMMPGMRGDELARRLHDRDPEIKVLYFTGYADQFFALRPVLRENETVLVKPVTMSEFLEAVSHRIQRGA